MPITDYPFVDLDGTPKPALPVMLINPANDLDCFTWALIDTGADTTVIPDFIAKKLYHNISHKSVKTDICCGVGGAVTIYYHTFRLKVLGLNKKKQVSLNKETIVRNKRLYAVVKGLHTMILGEDDFLNKYILTINYPKKIFSLKMP